MYGNELNWISLENIHKQVSLPKSKPAGVCFLIKRIMKTKFKIKQRQNPYISSLMVFTAVIRENNYDKGIVNKWFNTLVEKDDYAEEERDDVLEYIYSICDKNTLKKPL